MRITTIDHVPPRIAIRFLGISRSTLYRWEEEGKLRPIRTASGHRRYALDELRTLLTHKDRVTGGQIEHIHKIKDR